jgi:hypothetical protein
MIAYHARIQTQLNATRRPSDLSIGDVVYAHKTDLSRGKFAHSWRGPYICIGMMTGSNSFRLQSFIGNQAQRTTRNMNERRKFTQAVSDRHCRMDHIRSYYYHLSPLRGETSPRRCRRVPVVDRKVRKTRKYLNTKRQLSIGSPKCRDVRMIFIDLNH